MTDINLIVPPIFESEMTGFRLAAEKTIHRALWRVEFWRGDVYPRVFKNGARVQVAQCPEHAARFVNSVSRDYLSAAA
jgi:hypothetical protein